MQDRILEDIPIEDLKEAGCRKASSCAQVLVKALDTMVKSPCE
jgi:hypothetical protein